MQISESFVLKVIEKFTAGAIGELELDDGTSRLVLKQAPPPSGRGQAGRTDGSPGPAETGGETVSGGNGPVPGSAPHGESPADIITSPIVGTFYPSPGSDAPPFVRPGSKVKIGDTLCILEAMKMMNHLVAEFDCEILVVKAAAGDMVEYGQPLFEVKRL
ncbi:MAG: acetyl-CoA carboxylase biotin carboxyl carrier protein subunit [Treponema sp.]|nr:acetyl-CoA carboxylase biotin carboxyl carrier protein subunit [Treponema sp.]